MEHKTENKTDSGAWPMRELRWGNLVEMNNEERFLNDVTLIKALGGRLQVKAIRIDGRHLKAAKFDEMERNDSTGEITKWRLVKNDYEFMISCQDVEGKLGDRTYREWDVIVADEDRGIYIQDVTFLHRLQNIIKMVTGFELDFDIDIMNAGRVHKEDRQAGSNWGNKKNSRRTEFNKS